MARYYHAMEQGLLPAQGVSERVLEALSQIVGESAEALREAGRALRPPPSTGMATSQGAFARRAYTETPSAPAAAAAPGGEEEFDEVDALFRGG